MSSAPRGLERNWVVAVLASTWGPAMAGLHETGVASFGPNATLWPLVAIVGVAATGLLTGLRATAGVSRTLALLVAAPNVLVLLFYGFLLVFFGLGGSR